MGVLPDHMLLELGPTLIDPFDPAMVQPASIDVHMDRFIFRARTDTGNLILDPSVSNDDCFEPMFEVAEGEPFVLRPRDFVLASTFETVTIPDNLVARFEGKSSLGRIGMLSHITAGFIDPGFKGKITLELKNVSNFCIYIYPGMKIGQIAFEELAAVVDHPYGDATRDSHYQDQRGPTLSKSQVNFTMSDVYVDEVDPQVIVEGV